MKTRCPHCGQAYNVPVRRRDTAATCKACKKKFHVEDVEAEPLILADVVTKTPRNLAHSQHEASEPDRETLFTWTGLDWSKLVFASYGGILVIATVCVVHSLSHHEDKLPQKPSSQRANPSSDLVPHQLLSIEDRGFGIKDGEPARKLFIAVAVYWQYSRLPTKTELLRVYREYAERFENSPVFVGFYVAEYQKFGDPYFALADNCDGICYRQSRHPVPSSQETVRFGLTPTQRRNLNDEYLCVEELNESDSLEMKRQKRLLEQAYGVTSRQASMICHEANEKGWATPKYLQLLKAQHP